MVLKEWRTKKSDSGLGSTTRKSNYRGYYPYFANSACSPWCLARVTSMMMMQQRLRRFYYRPPPPEPRLPSAADDDRLTGLFRIPTKHATYSSTTYL